MKKALMLLASFLPASASAADLTVNNNSTFRVFAWAHNGYKLLEPGKNYVFESSAQWTSGFVLFQCLPSADCSDKKGSYINRARPDWEANQEILVLYEYAPWWGPLPPPAPKGTVSFVVGGNGDGKGHWTINVTDYGAGTPSRR